MKTTTTQNNPPAVECYKGKKPVNLADFKEQFKIVQTAKDSKGNSFNTIGTLNAAAWIGEHSGCLIEEIESLRNAHDAHVGTIGELREALKRASAYLDPCQCSKYSETICVGCEVEATLAKSQAKGSL